MRISKVKKRVEKLRPQSSHSYLLRTDAQTDRPVLTSAEKSTSIGIAVNQMHLVLSDYEIIYVLQRMEKYKISENLRQ